MKFAQVGYGTFEKHGEEGKKLYTYIVSDNVRTGDNLIVSVKHFGNGAIFSTTGHLPLKENGGGISSKMPESTNSKGENISASDLEQGYALKELGIDKKGGTSAYSALSLDKPNKITMEARAKVIGKETQREIGRGETPVISSGKKTQMALDYESYNKYMDRLGAK